MPHAGMPAGDGLSSGQLAEATGVAAGTLRMWEARHGFPAPTRGAGRHRRYSADDVERVGLVLADRDRGLSLAAAIERARAWSPAAPGSIFAAVRALQPSPQALRLPLWAMLAVSRAIEDECLARAGRPLLAGSFQTERAFRRAEHRWQELSRSAALSFVLADFVRPRTPRGGPLEVRTAAGMPVRREWAVIALDPHYTACLAAWELPRQAGERWFEAIWTTAAGVVTDAMRTAIGLAGPRVAERGAEALSTNAPPVADATPALANRMIGYLVERSG